jgi:hypothetical protein
MSKVLELPAPLPVASTCQICAGTGTIRQDYYPVPIWIPCSCGGK